MIEQPKITRDLVIATYKYYMDIHGRTSCGVVANDLNRRGYVSPRGRIVSRMSVWRMMQETREGREAIQETRERVGK